MKVFGLTGGIGMGKSTSDKLLRRRGFAVIDTDLIARQIVEPGMLALNEITQAFGQELLGEDGRLKRGELAKLVFNDINARQRLEAILHPKIREVWLQQLGDYREEGRNCAIVVIPLLFETKAESTFDAVVCVACSATTQKQRLLERGWDWGHAEQRIRAQWPTERKMSLANYVVWTEGDLDVHARQLERICPVP